MSRHRELETLKKQEATLIQLQMAFSDQLNRLKVEELALSNLLRLQHEKDNKHDSTVAQQTSNKPVMEQFENRGSEVLDLAVGYSRNEEEEEEEEDSEEEGYSYKDQLTLFLEDMLTRQKQDASKKTNKPEDDEEEM
ncbi:hypothetical protein C0Q70_01221 [Pomacea canaliculata]|uniref:snRNA-activating protein complex subunit 5 n=1 Tax=Pomacea canaliculata TaxID=400727 RepID=A0A2T7PYV1_POMCA|nr:snRNA-activating protein complex subunit 5-like [Pomacea canaliculata]PVD38605.1 hypothetical protein C0Q70_01221 [Pomacea canaliculata]